MLKALTSLPNFDWKDVQLTVMDFIAGGVFTITQSMAFFIHQVAINSRVQEKLVESLRTAPIPAVDPYLKVNVLKSFEWTRNRDCQYEALISSVNYRFRNRSGQAFHRVFWLECNHLT